MGGIFFKRSQFTEEMILLGNRVLCLLGLLGQFWISAVTIRIFNGATWRLSIPN